MAKLSPRQLEIIQKLRDGGYIWKAGDAHIVLTTKDAEGKEHAARIHTKTFDKLLAAKVIIKSGDKYVINAT